MRKKRNHCITLLFLATACAIVGLCVVANGGELDRIGSEGAAGAQRIASLQYEFQSQLTYTDDSEKPRHTDTLGTSYQQGPKVRVESATAAEDAQPISVIAAYNGGSYQLFFEEGKTLSFSRSPLGPNVTYTLTPLIVPYAWLFEMGSTASWEAITQKDTWLSRFVKAQYVETSEESGITCDVVKFPEVKVPGGEMEGMTNTVYFARDYGEYPLKSIKHLRNGKPLTTILVEKFEVVEVAGKRTLIPLSVSTQQEFRGRVDRSVFTVDRVSLKVNQPIDDDLFTLSPSRALVVQDVDKEPPAKPIITHELTATNRAERGVERTVEPPFAVFGWRYALGALGGIAVLLALRWRNQRRRGRA